MSAFDPLQTFSRRSSNARLAPVAVPGAEPTLSCKRTYVHHALPLVRQVEAGACLRQRCVEMRLTSMVIDYTTFHAWDEPQDVLAHLLGGQRKGDPRSSAAALLRQLGSFSAVLGAPWWTIRQHAGWRAAFALKRLTNNRRDALLARDQNRPCLSRREDVELFLREFTDRCDQEGLSAIFVDSGLRVVRVVDAHTSRFGYDMADVSSLMLQGSQLGASGFFLVHHCGEHANTSNRPPMLILDDPHLGASEDLPLIAQVVIAKNQVTFIGGIERGRR